MSVHPQDYSGQVARVAATRAAAEIPPSKLGPARLARLSEPERDLYFWILRRFATNGRPSAYAAFRGHFETVDIAA